MAISLFHWKYRKSISTLPLLWRIRRRAVPNFGDEIGPIVVRSIASERGLPSPEQSSVDGRLLSAGSVLHLANAGDHVWGTGINGKRPPEGSTTVPLQIYAVRGPQTAELLLRLGHSVPNVFGDPGLLIRHVPEINSLMGLEKTRKLCVIPNFNDIEAFRLHPDFVSPLQDPITVARAILESEMVVGSSLHAMVFADALGVPARLISSSHEPPFKYDDYYRGSGRDTQHAASTVEEALRVGPTDACDFDEAPLLDAFPDALFR